jgi:exodeoxyribonuclease V beta subunit
MGRNQKIYLYHWKLKSKQAMNASNYNLQYIIYTVAVKRWLESRIPDFDYERQFGGVIYLFLRGIRQDSNTGVFSCTPPADHIRQLDKLLNGK